MRLRIATLVCILSLIPIKAGAGPIPGVGEDNYHLAFGDECSKQGGGRDARTAELQQHWGSFLRTCKGVTKSSDFADLCAASGYRCDYVGDWEGHTRGCAAFPGDASGVAFCRP